MLRPAYTGEVLPELIKELIDLAFSYVYEFEELKEGWNLSYFRFHLMLAKSIKMALLWERLIHMMMYDKQELIRMVQRVMDCGEDRDTIKEML